MSKRRTRKDKTTAHHEYTYHAEVLPYSPKVKKAEVGPTTSQSWVLGFDPHLIHGDLVKTVIVSVIVFSIELSIYWYLNH